MNNGQVSQGLCPSCDEAGTIGELCPEKVCAKRGYRYLPPEYHAKVAQQPAGAADPVLGQLIGDYLVVDVLGAGGFGTVYMALQQPIQLKAALKLMNLRADPEIADMMLEKFRAEAAALASLSHPNIVRLLKFGKFGDMPYLVMEFVEGARTLKDEIAACAVAGHPMDLNATMHILNLSLNALEAAHERAIVHRDIKPDNIMLQKVSGDPFFVRILDFGLAKFTDQRSLTSTTVGTPVYMAPEQLTKGRIGPWTDLYALGIMAYELLTGMSPFPGHSQQAILTKKVDPSYDPTSRLTEKMLPPHMIRFFERAIHRDETERFQHAGQFRQALRDLHEAIAANPDAHVIGDISEIIDEVSVMKARRRGTAPSNSSVSAPPRIISATPSAPVDMMTSPNYGAGYDKTMAASDEVAAPVLQGVPQSRPTNLGTDGEPRKKKSMLPFIGAGVAVAAAVSVALALTLGGGGSKADADPKKDATEVASRQGSVESDKSGVSTAGETQEVKAGVTEAEVEAEPSPPPTEPPPAAVVPEEAKPTMAADDAKAMKMKALMMVAGEHAKQKRWADAMTAYGEALVREPDNADAKAGFTNASAEKSRVQALSKAAKSYEDGDLDAAETTLLGLGDVSTSVYVTDVAALKKQISDARVAAATKASKKKTTKRTASKAAPKSDTTATFAKDPSPATTATAEPPKTVTAPPKATAPPPKPKAKPRATAKKKPAPAPPKAVVQQKKTLPPPPPQPKRKKGQMVKIDKLGKVHKRLKGKVKQVTGCQPPKMRCKALNGACVSVGICNVSTRAKKNKGKRR